MRLAHEQLLGAAGRFSSHTEPLLPLPRPARAEEQHSRPPAGGAPALLLPGGFSASGGRSCLRVGRVFSNGTGDPGLKASENSHNRRFQLVMYWSLFYVKERFYLHQFLATERYCTTYSWSNRDVRELYQKETCRRRNLLIMWSKALCQFAAPWGSFFNLSASCCGCIIFILSTILPLEFVKKKVQRDFDLILQYTVFPKKSQMPLSGSREFQPFILSVSLNKEKKSLGDICLK